ncbi:MAG: hypothetical protein V3U10_00980, partial [Bacteroidota bacterium]
MRAAAGNGSSVVRSFMTMLANELQRYYRLLHGFDCPFRPHFSGDYGHLCFNLYVRSFNLDVVPSDPL